MKINHLAGKRLATAAFAVIATAGLTASAVAGAQAAPGDKAASDLYIVQVAGDALSTYEGGVAGFAATKPAEGEKLDAHSSAAKNWLSKLNNDHVAALKAAHVDTAKKVLDYGTVFNGFAARLTASEVARLRASNSVVQIWKNEMREADTTTTRDFLGLTGPNGVWAKQFKGDAHAGEGVIVGIVDSGIWPENPAFAALPEPRPDAKTIAKKWKGTCDAGQEEVVACNNKLLGAHYYHTAIQNMPEEEFVSPRDYNGHGSHTASTAAGNGNVPVSINGYDLGTASGMAPAARIAVYKALWEKADHTGASGGTVDLVDAINQAVADGVDVLNYSISGSSDSIVGPDEIAFFNAAAAGVFVSTSAGNGGINDIAHNAPWTTTVAASTHDRGNAKTVTLGNGASYTGVGVIPPAVASLPLVNSENIPAAGRTAAEAKLCLPGSIDPAAAAGKIVLCTRGNNARTDKGLTVKDAGGAGMILANAAQGQGLVGDWHVVPTVHLEGNDGLAVKAYIASAGAGATAAFSATSTAKVQAPVMAGFSSFGPAAAGNGDLLKPDITAPGVDVIAAVAPPGNAGRNFDAYSGTSMSAPHIAGIAALLAGKFPKWSPMAIKSALMTTATTLDNTGNPIQLPAGAGAASPLNYGAGHVVPSAAFNPGLVYESGTKDWINYSCAIGQQPGPGVHGEKPAFDCTKAKAIDPSDLNYPSISVGDLAGVQTITRTVTNVTNSIAIYEVKATAPAGFTAKVSGLLGSQYLIVLPGGKASYKVTFTRTTAAFGQWSFGSVTLSEVGTGSHKVTSPVALRPVGVAAPVQVVGSGTSGSSAIALKAGFGGTLVSNPKGLVAANVTTLNFAATDQSFNSNAPEESDGAKLVEIDVPAGTTYSRVALFDGDVPAGTDMDLFVYDENGDLFGQSAGGTAEESVSDLPAGHYYVFVVLFAAENPAATAAKLNVFSVPGTAAGNFTATPASQSVTIAGNATVTANWTGLTAGTRYMGTIEYTDGTNAAGRTIFLIQG